MKKIILLFILAVFSLPSFFHTVSGNDSLIPYDSGYTLPEHGLSDSVPMFLPPMMGEKFIRYMHRPDKKRMDEDPGPMRYYVLEVSTDVMEGGIRRAMPFTTLVRGDEEFFVAFEVVTSFDTEEEVLKYAEENGITDIDLKGYIDVPEDEPMDIPEKPGKD